MFDQLLNLVRQVGQKSVVENPDVPNEHNEGVLQEAASSIFSKLKSLVNGGDTENLAGALQGDPNHPAITATKENFIDGITRKLGIQTGTAQGVADSLIPGVFGSLINRQGNGSGFSLSSLLASLGSGNENPQHQGMLQSIGVKLGLDRNGDGHVDLSDLSSLLH